MTHFIRNTCLLLPFCLSVPLLAAEPLPKGAKARLGTSQLRESGSWNGALLAPDGKHLIVQLQKGLTKFDVTTGEPAGVIGEKAGGFDRRFELSADGKRALTVNYSLAVVWDTGTGKTIADVKRTIPFGDTASSLAANGKVFALGGALDFNAKDKPISALVWDIDKNAKLCEVNVVQNQSANVVLSADGKLLATWGTHFDRTPPKEGAEPRDDPNRIVQIWDAETGKELAKVRLDGFFKPYVTFAPDGQTVAVTGGNGVVALVDPRTGIERRRLFGRANQSGLIAFSPDGKTLASSGADSAIQLFNTAEGTRTALVESPTGPLANGVRGLVFISPERAVAWTAVGLTAIVWEVPSGKLISSLAGHVAAIRSIAFHNDGKEILTGGDDGLLLRWDVAGKELGEVKLRTSGVYGIVGRYSMYPVALTADGKTAVAGVNGSAIFDPATGRELAGSQPGDSSSRARLGRDARTLLSVPYLPLPPKPQPTSFKIPVWDLSTGRKLCTLETPAGDLSQAEVSPDRSKIALAMSLRTADNKTEFQVLTFELATGKKLGTFTEVGGFGPSHLVFAPDNVSGLVHTPAGKLVAINLVEGKPIKEIETNHRTMTAAPVFAADGKQFSMSLSAGFGLASTSDIQIVNWDSGKTVATFLGHTGQVTCLAFSPDGKTLATGGFDATVLLWDVSAKSE